MANIILKQQEVKENIANIINTSNLPAFILKSIIKDIYMQLESIEAKQYQEALKEKEEKEKEDNG